MYNTCSTLGRNIAQTACAKQNKQKICRPSTDLIRVIVPFHWCSALPLIFLPFWTQHTKLFTVGSHTFPVTIRNDWSFCVPCQLQRLYQSKTQSIKSHINGWFIAHGTLNSTCERGLGGEGGGWMNRKAEIEKVDFVAADEAGKAIFLCPPGLKAEAFHSWQFPTEGTFISVFTVPHHEITIGSPASPLSW